VGKKLLVAALATSTLVNIVAVFTFGTYWREHVRRRRQMPVFFGGPMPGLLKEKLKLTDTQVDSIQKLHRAMIARIQPLGRQELEERRKLMSVMADPSAGRERSDSLFRATIALQDQIEQEVYANMLQIRALLTPEQLRELSGLSADLFEGGSAPGFELPGPGRGPADNRESVPFPGGLGRPRGFGHPGGPPPIAPGR